MGNDNTNRIEFGVTGRPSHGLMNGNSERLYKACSRNCLVTIFPYKEFQGNLKVTRRYEDSKPDRQCHGDHWEDKEAVVMGCDMIKY